MHMKAISAGSGLVIAALSTLISPALWPITIPLALLSGLNLRNALKRQDQ